MKKYESLIPEVPVDGYDDVTTTCWKVSGSTLSYVYETLFFTDFNEAYSYMSSIKESTINGERTQYADITEYTAGYWQASGLNVYSYTR